MQRAPAPDLIDRLLSTGVIEGPFRRTRPLTVNRRTRFLRWLRATFQIWSCR